MRSSFWVGGGVVVAALSTLSDSVVERALAMFPHRGATARRMKDRPNFVQQRLMICVYEYGGWTTRNRDRGG